MESFQQQGYLSNREQWPDIDWVMRANYLSQWKFQAGILMALMVGVFVFGVRRIRGGGTNRDWWVVVTGLVGGVILASPTHSILSVVHFNVWPHYPYKAATAVFLLLVLIGMCLQRFLVARNISSRTSVLIFFTSFIYFVANYWACSYKQNSFLRFVWGEDGFFLKGFLPPTDLFF